MTNDPHPVPVVFDDLADSLAYALLFNDGKRTHDADDMMAVIVAKRLLRHLDRCGYVVVKRPPGPGRPAHFPVMP